MMKYLTYGLLFGLIHLSCFADSLCNNGGSFDAQSGMCISTSGSYSQGSPANQPYQPRDYYGAIAADVVNGKSSGHADNFQAQSAAQSGALESCGLSGCQIIISYKNACGSMVAAKTPIGSPNHVVGGVGNTPAEAEQNAFTECERLNPGVQCLMWSKGKCSYRE